MMTLKERQRIRFTKIIMMTLKERRRIRFFKIINFCHQMIDLLNGATVQGIILDEESCRLTILNNLNHVPFSKYRRWRMKKYLDKSNSYIDKQELKNYLMKTQAFYDVWLQDIDFYANDYIPMDKIRLQKLYLNKLPKLPKLPVYLSESQRNRYLRYHNNPNKEKGKDKK